MDNQITWNINIMFFMKNVLRLHLFSYFLNGSRKLHIHELMWVEDADMYWYSQNARSPHGRYEYKLRLLA